MAEPRKPSSRERGERDRKAATTTASRSKDQPKGQPKAQPGKGQAKPAGASAARKAREARGAAARRAAEKQRRRRTMLYSGVTVLVLGALVAFVVVANRKDTAPTDQSYAKEQKALAPARQAAGCSDIQEYPNAGGRHIADTARPSNWNSNPPTSGDHVVTPLPGDFYTGEQDERMLLHSLEHGYVAVQYKNISPDQVAKLRELQKSYSGNKFIVMPYSGLPKDGVTITAWQHLQSCSRLDLSLVKSFVENYMVGAGRNRSVAPEPFAQ